MIEALVTSLIHQAPALSPATAHELRTALLARDTPLALAIARVVELVLAGSIDQGIALPALAMACATLEDASLGPREVEAARFEIETLLPLPGAVPKAAPGLIQLSRGPRPRT